MTGIAFSLGLKLRIVVACTFASAITFEGRAASAALDVIPATGGPAIHLRITQTSAGVEGPHMVVTDCVVKRTSATTATLQQGSDTDQLQVDAQGALQTDSTAPGTTRSKLGEILRAFNAAHGVMGVLGAGDRPGWSAQIPTVSPAQSPGPPLTLPILAVSANGGVDFEGAVETTQTAAEAAQESRSQGGDSGEGGGRGRGPRGGNDSGDRGSRSPAVPVIHDVRVTGHIAGTSLTRLSITDTRRVVLDGLSYTNVAGSTFEVMP